MKALKIVIQAVVLLGVLLAVIGWILPSKAIVERAIDINTPTDPIYKMLITPSENLNWSPWAKIDPEGTTWTYEGPSAGEGAILKWSSDHKEVGSGQQTWQTCIHNKEIINKIEFEGYAEPSYATFLFDEFDGYTEVTWQFEVNFGANPFAHYGYLFIEPELGPIFEKGLRNMKKYLEAQHLGEEELDFELEGDALVDSLQHLQEVQEVVE
ncbi:SRPBCC family protein [Reichenbachiella versicolor]|uniref:hypothetical protein n=1 Tax=Reichenbachiella versicolor TaxID=1821036 RepID=UPI000D6DF12B|nr:hypothetical protein [Reichenbachiella versicolor]